MRLDSLLSLCSSNSQSDLHIGINLMTQSLPLGCRNPLPEFPSGRTAACRHARMHSELSEAPVEIPWDPSIRATFPTPKPPNRCVLPPDRTPKPGQMPEVKGYFYVLI
jgi:hypothetical protein